MKKFNQLAKKNFKIFLSSIKTKVAVKFSKKNFFLLEIGLLLKGLISELSYVAVFTARSENTEYS